MKFIFAFFVMLHATVVWSAEQAAPPQAAVLKGEVLEVKNVESYSYLRLKTTDGEVWAAVGKAPIKKGAKVTIENVMVMNNFESKALKRKFDKIVFGSLGGTGAGAGSAMTAAHSGAPKVDYAGEVKVAKAGGPDGKTVAEVVTKSAELKDKTVQVRGRVVKFSASIMGKNWVHLRDGSGSAIDNSNDVLVTTLGQASVGDVVLVKGIVRTDKDFGSGYSYKVLIEEATLQK
jgi:hypothetical protein